MDDKVRIRCPNCTRLFRDRAQRIRDGYQVNCEHCARLITFTRDTEDPFMRRTMKLARETRLALEAKVTAERAASAAAARSQREY
ncbi:hypothetical protein JQ596_19130 [Bradyrhizobium manausense]|uniref:hypothetical protein n=1 Tax=Bradyrhizobium TaxID=374 RepID=UPI001BAC8C12|nr:MULTISPECIES: hypothetical protein [Bradyrhizobium]MBR0827644.1 hypothetical protein [Bradyrhizobium manausense]UVO26122.1 hypothetical protein KUF59_26590 [Bradyrhizobium arachidis]